MMATPRGEVSPPVTGSCPLACAAGCDRTDDSGRTGESAATVGVGSVVVGGPGKTGGGATAARPVVVVAGAVVVGAALELVVELLVVGAAGTHTGTTTVATIGVQMNWTLYSGGAVQNRIKETQVLEEKSRQDLEAARRSVAQSTRVAYFGLLSGQAQVNALEAAEASSKLALEATQLGYRVGVRVNLDVLNAQTQLFTTQRDLSQARYNVLLGTLRLRQASGQLLASDVDRVNRFLAQ